MEEIKYIVESFKQYGFKTGVFVTISLIVVYMFKVGWISKLFTKVQEFFVMKFLKSENKKNDNGLRIAESDVVNHDIFNYINFWVNSKIPTLQYSSEYRTIVFRKYLIIYYKSYKKNISDFIISGEYKTMDNAQLWNRFLKLVNDIVWDYESNCREIGIPEIIIEKMKIRNNDTIDLIIDLMGGICDSTFYDSENNLLKVYSILNIILSVLENTISNSELICNSINGQLKGQIFNDGGRIVKE